MSQMLTLCFLCRLDLFLDLEGFSGMNNVDDGTGSSGLQVLQEYTSVATVRIRRVYAFR